MTTTHVVFPSSDGLPVAHGVGGLFSKNGVVAMADDGVPVALGVDGGGTFLGMADDGLPVSLEFPMIDWFDSFNHSPHPRFYRYNPEFHSLGYFHPFWIRPGAGGNTHPEYGMQFGGQVWFICYWQFERAFALAFDPETIEEDQTVQVLEVAEGTDPDDYAGIEITDTMPVSDPDNQTWDGDGYVIFVKWNGKIDGTGVTFEKWKPDGMPGGEGGGWGFDDDERPLEGYFIASTDELIADGIAYAWLRVNLVGGGEEPPTRSYVVLLKRTAIEGGTPDYVWDYEKSWMIFDDVILTEYKLSQDNAAPFIWKGNAYTNLHESDVGQVEIWKNSTLIKTISANSGVGARWTLKSSESHLWLYYRNATTILKIWRYDGASWEYFEESLPVDLQYIHHDIAAKGDNVYLTCWMADPDIPTLRKWNEDTETFDAYDSKWTITDTSTDANVYWQSETPDRSQVLGACHNPVRFHYRLGGDPVNTGWNMQVWSNRDWEQDEFMYRIFFNDDFTSMISPWIGKTGDTSRGTGEEVYAYSENGVLANLFDNGSKAWNGEEVGVNCDGAGDVWGKVTGAGPTLDLWANKADRDEGDELKRVATCVLTGTGVLSVSEVNDSGLTGKVHVLAVGTDPDITVKVFYEDKFWRGYDDGDEFEEPRTGPSWNNSKLANPVKYNPLLLSYLQYGVDTYPDGDYIPIKDGSMLTPPRPKPGTVIEE